MSFCHDSLTTLAFHTVRTHEQFLKKMQLFRPYRQIKLCRRMSTSPVEVDNACLSIHRKSGFAKDNLLSIIDTTVCFS
jgi:hypothetical protein